MWWSRSTFELFLEPSLTNYILNMEMISSHGKHSHFTPHTAYLVSKLIAGHTQNNESLGGVPTVELVHLSVVPDCWPSERRDILNENDFALQCRETEHFSRQQLSCQVVKPFHIPCHDHQFRMNCADLQQMFCLSSFKPSNYVNKLTASQSSRHSGGGPKI